MLQATTGKQKTIQIEKTPEGYLADGQPFAWDLAELKPGHFHILHNNKSYQAEVVSVDAATKTYTLKLNGHLHTIVLQDQLDLLLKKLGMGDASAKKVQDIKAPMPGLIVDIKVTEGQEVKKGDPILVLEAMKMENILKSPGDGVIKSIKVQLRQNVEKNAVLVTF